jgi:general secretion pathway protein C
MTARWAAFGLWGAVAATLVYWALKLFVPGVPAPQHAALAATTATPRGDLTRLFGRDPVPETQAEPPPTARFHLLGVVAPRSAAGAREGLALIAVDDRPPRAYRVGAVVDGNTVLQSVSARGAALGPRDGPEQVSLDIPPPMPAATGSLPVAGDAGVAQPPSLLAAPRLTMRSGVGALNGAGATRPPSGLMPGPMTRLQRPQGGVGQVPQPQQPQQPLQAQDEAAQPVAPLTQ